MTSNLVSLAPKYLISRLFAELDLSKSEEILRKEILKIHGTRLYLINLWTTGTSMGSHSLGLLVCLFYLFGASYPSGIDLHIILYTLVFYGRFLYSFSRYKRYFSKEVTENPFNLKVNKHSMKKENIIEEGREEEEDCFCAICY